MLRVSTCLLKNLDDNDDNDDDVEHYCDAEGADHACENEEEACRDSVSDSVTFEANSDDVDVNVELPESQSDSMLCRLPVALDVVQELPDSASEDVTDNPAGDDDLVAAVSPSTLSPTSPVSGSDHVIPSYRSSLSSPDSYSKPPIGAVALRKSPKSGSVEKLPRSPEYAIVQGHKVELRPAKVTSATKRVSSFRKSLIKLVSFLSIIVKSSECNYENCPTCLDILRGQIR